MPLIGVGILGLGVAAATTMFSVVDAVLFRAAPWRDAQRLVVIHAVRPDQRQNPALARSWNRAPLSWSAWRDLQKSPAFAAVGVWLPGQQILGPDRSDLVNVYYASASFLEVLGVKPLMGRFFTVEDDEEMSETVIISHEAWRRRFGGRPDIVGQHIALAYTFDSASLSKIIIGVLPPAFRFQGESPEFLLPMGLMAFNGSFEANRFLRAVGRLAEDVSPGQAESIAEPLVRRDEPPSRRTARVVSLTEDAFGAVARPLWFLLAAAGLLLAIACSNVAGLLLVDGRARQLEIATRVALGATRRQLIGQFATESCLVALGGSIAGALIAYWITPALVAVAPPEIRAIGPIAVSARAAAWSLSIGYVIATSFAIVPIVFAVAARSTMAADSRAFRAGSSIIAGQLALALVLTVSAGVFSAALLDVKSSPLGFEPHGLAIARVKLTSRPALQTSALRPDTAYGKSTARAAREGLMNSGWAHTTDVVHRLETLPGVISAAAANVAPFSGTASAATLREPGDASASDIQVQWRAVTEGYFRTLRIPILSGRALLASDRDYGQPYWAVLSSDGQRQLNSDGMIGKELLWGQSSPLRIIGIAGQVQHQPSDRLFGSPALYLINFRVDQVGCFLVRTSGDPRELLPAIRQTIEADGSVKVTSTAAMADIVADSMAEERFRALLTILFGAIALVLAAVGLFGLMSYHVTRRRQEIAIRMALGADTSRIRRLVMRDAAIIVAAGIAIGLPVALAAFQLLRTVLAGVQPQPMRAVAIGAATLCLAAAAAVVLPVLRAARVEPGHLLRN